MASLLFPQKDSRFIQTQTGLILDSYARWFHRTLYPVQGSASDQAFQLFEAPFILLSSNTDSDPLLNYGNQKCLELWELTWEELRKTPGRLTAEPDEQTKRAAFLKEVRENGFIQNYEGIRISKTGKRFYIKNVAVWNLLDTAGNYAGQAAMFTEWIKVERRK